MGEKYFLPLVEKPVGSFYIIYVAGRHRGVFTLRYQQKNNNTMEIQLLNQTEFAEMLKSAGNETHQTTFVNDVWYEQVTIGEVTYRHKLLSLKKLSSELLAKKAFEAKPCVEPIRLRAQGNGPVVALVFNTKSTVFYHLLVGTKREMAQAKSLVNFFAKSLLPKTTKQPQEAEEASCAA